MSIRHQLQLDHVFVLCPDRPEEADLLQSHGFPATPRRQHQGQGTSNRCFFFQDAFLELLYPTNEAELRSPAVFRTRLWERASWRQGGVSPFGVCLRGSEPWPVLTWPYLAPFLPPGGSIPIAEDEPDSTAPLLFFLPPITRPPPPASSPQRITRIRIESPRLPAWHAVMRAHAPFLELIQSPRHMMTLELDGAAERRRMDLGQDCPVQLRP